MRTSLPLLLMMMTLGVASNAVAQSGAVAYAGDLQSIDRAVLESAELSLPPSAPAPAMGPNRGFVTPAAHTAGLRPQATEPQQAKPKVGLFNRMKGAWGFGKKEAKPATDPFQAAQQSAKQQLVQRDAAVGPIPAYVAQRTGSPVQAAAYQGRKAPTQPTTRGGMPAMRAQSGPRQGLLSGLFGGSSEPSVPAASMPAQVASRQAAQPKPPMIASARSKTRPGSSVARTAPKPPPVVRPRTAPRPTQVATPTRTQPKPSTTTNPYTKRQAPPAAMVMISDTDEAAPAPKPIAKPAPKSATMTYANTSAPKPTAPKIIAVKPAEPIPPAPMTPPVAEPNPLPEVVAQGPTPKPAPEPVVSAPAPLAPAVVEPQVVQPQPVPAYAVTTPEPAPTIERRVLPSRPVQPAEPTERAKSLLAEAHELAATAGSYDEFTAVVKRCRYVLAIDGSTAAQAYANQLAGWALTKRGEVLDDDGRMAEAEVDYHDALRCDPECWRAEHALGVQAARNGDAEAALRRFNRTIGLNPEYAKAYSNRAALSVQAGDYRAALDDYAEAIAIDPDLAVAHTGRGRVCHMLGLLDDGLRHLDAAELLAPADAMIASGRGDLLTDLGRYGQAIAAYQRAITLDPDSPVAYRNLAWTQATCPTETFRDGAAALRNAERAEQLSSASDDLILDTKAAALASLGRFDEAAQLQKEAVELAPESDAAAYRARLAMYERSESFTSRPVDVEQATYTR